MALPTSGTVGQTSVDIMTLIEHAVRRCGMLTPTLTAEQQLAAKENLYFILTGLSNEGINLWTIKKYVLPLVEGQQTVPLPFGTADVLDMFWRRATYPTQTMLSGATWIGTDLITAQNANTMRVLIGTGGSYTFAVEFSADLVTWTVSSTFNKAVYTAGQKVYFDPDLQPKARYWRVRETVLPTWSDATSVRAGVNATQLQITLMNRDDYTNLPIGQSLTANGAGRPLQAWFDKQINSSLRLWPAAPAFPSGQIIVWTNGDIEDLGAFTNAVAIPSRWYDAIINLLAAQCALELPKIDPTRIQMLQGMGEASKQKASRGEQDGSAFKIMPNIRAYTRG